MEDRVRLKRLGETAYRGSDVDDGTGFLVPTGEEFECSAAHAKLLQTFNRAGFEVVGATGDGLASGVGGTGSPAPTTSEPIAATVDGTVVQIPPGTYTAEELAKAAGLEAGATGTPTSIGSDESGTGSAPAPALKSDDWEAGGSARPRRPRRKPAS